MPRKEKGLGFVTSVKQIGNSLYALIPSEVKEFLELAPGDQLYVEIKIVKKGEK